MAVVVRPYAVGPIGVSQDTDAITLPAGTKSVQVGVIVTPGMFATPEFCVRMSSAYKQSSSGTVIGGGLGSLSAGVEGGQVGGQAGEEPGVVPAAPLQNFVLDWRDSSYLEFSSVNAPNGSDNIPVGDVLLVVRTVACGGDPGGVSHAIIVEALDEHNTPLTW